MEWQIDFTIRTEAAQRDDRVYESIKNHLPSVSLSELVEFRQR